jgi:hypothetical protein
LRMKLQNAAEHAPPSVPCKRQAIQAGDKNGYRSVQAM